MVPKTSPRRGIKLHTHSPIRHTVKGKTMAKQPADLDEQKKLAEIRATNAEAEKLEVEAELAKLAFAQQQLDHEDELIKFERRQRAYAAEDAEDAENYVYYFNTSVSAGSVANLRHTLNTWARVAEPGTTFTVHINSGGGSVFDGLDAGDCISDAQAQGFKVNVHVVGMAASMAGAILQFGDERVIGRNSWLHLHEVSTGAAGKAADLADSAELAKRLTAQICDLYAKRAKKAIGKKAQKAEEIHDWIERQERWLTADQAVELGFADRIG